MLSIDRYAQSWELYKQHSSVFKDDLPYYHDFVSGHSTLELFAGYGRVTNYLVKRKEDIEAVDLSRSLLKFVDLPDNKRHHGDAINFQTQRKFERVFAAYDSFPLIIDPTQIKLFFKNLSSMMKPGARASLNYYQPSHWADAINFTFLYKGINVHYKPSYDLSRSHEKIGIWCDLYEILGKQYRHEYPVRIYESKEDLIPFLKDTGLRLVEVVENFDLSQLLESGWQDFILEKET